MIYVGCHCIRKNLKTYLGSGTNIKKAVKEFGKHSFKKEILFTFDNKYDMLAKEREIVNEEFIARHDTYNIILGGGEFYVGGNITVKDKNGKFMMVHVTDPRYLSGELIHIGTNKVIVKDKNGIVYQVSKNHPNFLSGEYVGITKGITLMRDKENNIVHASINDPKFLNGELVGLNKGKKFSKETCAKMSIANSVNNKGLICIHKENIDKRVKKNILQEYINNGWLLGKSDKSKSPILNRNWINNGLINKTVPNYELNLYLESGWKHGRKS